MRSTIHAMKNKLRLKKEENNERRPWGKQSRGYRTEHTILLEKRETL